MITLVPYACEGMTVDLRQHFLPSCSLLNASVKNTPKDFLFDPSQGACLEYLWFNLPTRKSCECLETRSHLFIPYLGKQPCTVTSINATSPPPLALSPYQCQRAPTSMFHSQSRCDSWHSPQWVCWTPSEPIYSFHLTEGCAARHLFIFGKLQPFSFVPSCSTVEDDFMSVHTEKHIPVIYLFCPQNEKCKNHFVNFVYF